MGRPGAVRRRWAEVDGLAGPVGAADDVHAAAPRGHPCVVWDELRGRAALARLGGK